MTGQRVKVAGDQPQRIQQRRVKGWRKPEGAVSVVRGTDWGNPYRVGETVQIEAPSVYTPGAQYVLAYTITPEIAVLLFRIWVSGRYEDQIRADLGGRTLMCWCPIGAPCHADVLLAIANGSAPWVARQIEGTQP